MWRARADTLVCACGNSRLATRGEEEGAAIKTLTATMWRGASRERRPRSSSKPCASYEPDVHLLSKGRAEMPATHLQQPSAHRDELGEGNSGNETFVCECQREQRKIGRKRQDSRYFIMLHLRPHIRKHMRHRTIVNDSLWPFATPSSGNRGRAYRDTPVCSGNGDGITGYVTDELGVRGKHEPQWNGYQGSRPTDFDRTTSDNDASS